MAKTNSEISNELKQVLASRLETLTERGKDADYRNSIPKQIEGSGVNYQTFMKYLSKAQSCGSENLYRLAKHFGVSADYLLGLSNVRTTDTDIQSVCNYTGLDERNVEALNHLKTAEKGQIQEHGYSYITDELEILNFMIQKPRISMLSELRAYLSVIRKINIIKKENQDMPFSTWDKIIDFQQRKYDVNIEFSSEKQKELFLEYMDLKNNQQMILYRVCKSFNSSIEEFVNNKENEYASMDMDMLQELHENIKKSFEKTFADRFNLDDNLRQKPQYVIRSKNIRKSQSTKE